jgi:hypothetical protein
MKDNVKLKIIDTALAGDDIGVAYDRHGKWVIYNASSRFDRVIFKWEGKRDDRPMESMAIKPVPLKTALEMVDANWDFRLAKGDV